MDAQRKVEIAERHFGRTLDQHERLLITLGEISCHVIGTVKNDRPEFILVPLGDGLTEGDLYRARLNGYYFVGCFSYASGFADASVEPGPDAWRVLVAATPAFFQYLSERLAPKGDTVDWLKELWAKPDPREN